MTEPLVNLRQLLRGLHEHRIEYVVTGAGAMLFYGYVRNTEDLDIVVAPDQENLDRVAEWLRSIDAVLKLNPQRQFGAREQWGLQKGSNATVLTSLGQATWCSDAGRVATRKAPVRVGRERLREERVVGAPRVEPAEIADEQIVNSRSVAGAHDSGRPQLRIRSGWIRISSRLIPGRGESTSRRASA